MPHRFASPCRFAVTVVTLGLFPLMGQAADDAGWIKLDLNAFKEPHAEWFLTDHVAVDAKNPKRLAAQAGKGDIMVNGKARTRDIVTKQKFKDVEAHFEFMIPKGSNSGVKFEGLYEVQIVDSFGKKNLKGDDCGGIYPRAEAKPKYHHIDDGVPPRVNASKPAGEWQSLDIIFHAPRFDASGKKIANAKFVKVFFNGQVIHENVEVPYPTGANWVKKEIPEGPILLQADHGPVAFRNMRARVINGE